MTPGSAKSSTAGGYSAGLAQGQPILAVHIQELRDRVVAAWNSSSQIPRDGHASLAYDVASNRITTSGFDYDKAGNQVRALIPGSGTTSQRFQYDAAGRLVKVKADDNTSVIATYTYGDSNERLIAEEGGFRTYYDCEGGATIAEYVESGSSTTPSWSKSYVYLGERLLSTLTPNGSGGEAIQYHHPDQLGTKLVTDPSNGTSFEQVTLPFGTALNAESTGSTNRRFTSYDRSNTSGLDYAVNRHYDSQQGRFTQVDPAGMRANSLTSPQTLNLYAYCTNDPINQVDPSGLGLISFFKRVLKGIGKILSNKWVRLIVGIALGALAGLGFIWTIQGATQFLVPALALAAMSALLIVGAFHPNLLKVTGTISSILSSVQGFAGLINGTINGGMLGTPPWNPNAGSGVGPVFNLMNPQHGYSVPDNYYNILAQTIADVRQRLKDKPECRKLLGNQNIEDTLNKISIGARDQLGKIYFNPHVGATTLQDTGPNGERLPSGTIRFNSLHGFFFFSHIIGRGTSQGLGLQRTLGQSELRQLVLIHELVHVGDVSGRFDDPDFGPNVRLNRLIARKCF